MKFSDTRVEYSVKNCPSDDLEGLEELLNQMSEEGWDLYTLHETETEKAGMQYNCIFQREYQEVQIEENELVEVSDFKSRMEKMLNTSNDPYDQCVEIQNKIKQKQKEIEKIKNLLDKEPSGVNKESLNEKISDDLKDLDKFKAQLTLVVNPDRMFDRISQDKLTIVVSEELLKLVDIKKDGSLIAETVKLRQKLTDKYGYIVPSIKFTDADTLESNEFRIFVRGIKAFSGFVYPDCLKLNAEQAKLTRKPKDAIEEIDPITNQKFYWLKEEKTKDFWEKGLNPTEVIVKALEFVVFQYVNEIIDYKDMNRYIQIVGEQNIYLVENLLSEHLSIGELRRVFADLIREKVPVKDILFIFEKINDAIEDKDHLMQNLRLMLKRQVCAAIADENDIIYAITITDKLKKDLQKIIGKKGISIKNKLFRSFATKIISIINLSKVSIDNIALILPSEIRESVSDGLFGLIPDLSIVSDEEITSEFTFELLENIEEV